MQSGSWHTGDFDGNGYTDFFHASGANSVHVWLATAAGSFTVVQSTPAPAYCVQCGFWRVLDFSGDGRSDLVHLCCSTYVETWRSDGDGTFTSTGSFEPWPGYVAQQGQWLTGRFNSAGGPEDLIHICCANTANIWISNGNGTFWVVNNGWSPWPGYGMLEGSWHAADFTGEGRTDLLHAWGGANAKVWKARTDGTFDVNGFSPGSGYCMLC
jgi:hypothetical protein